MPSLNELREEYERLYATAEVRANAAHAVERAAARIAAGRRRYEAVGVATGVPWVVIGIIHAREADCDFGCHLHNGDPLTARTHHVPAGRPAYGSPPFTWEDSAADALRYDHVPEFGPWDTAAALYAAEVINGFGYRHHGIVSPYVWGGTNHQARGKYHSDGYFDRSEWDTQPGAAALLMTLLARFPDALGTPWASVVTPGTARASSPSAPTSAPAAVTARAVAVSGSRTMGTLLAMQSALRVLLGSAAGLFTLDNLGLAKGYLDAIKTLCADHASLLVVVGVLAGLALAGLAETYLVAAARDGRYVPRGAAGAGGDNGAEPGDTPAA